MLLEVLLDHRTRPPHHRSQHHELCWKKQTDYVLCAAGSLQDPAGAPTRQLHHDQAIATAVTNGGPRWHSWRKDYSFTSVFISADELLRLPNLPVNIETKNLHSDKAWKRLPIDES